jgi:hypothetical protein
MVLKEGMQKDIKHNLNITFKEFKTERQWRVIVGMPCFI